MPSYQAESFYRAKIKTSILSTTAVPFTITVSAIPNITNWLLTISPNTEYEEIVEYNNPNNTTKTIDIVKRGIKPSSILLTTAWVDYNNTTYYKEHTQNDVIRADVNHIHINQWIGNTTLATNTWVGISKLSIAAVDVNDPIVVGNNDPRVADSSTTNKWVIKLSVAPVSPTSPIACWDNDPRLTPTLATNLVNWVSKLSLAPAVAGTPIAVWDNDTRLRVASTTVDGRVEIATQSELNAWTSTWGTWAPLVVWPAELKVKTDSIATVAASALANDTRLNTTLTASWVSGTYYSTTYLMPRWGWISMTTTSWNWLWATWYVETSADWVSWWTDTWYAVTANNWGAWSVTSLPIFVPIKGAVYVRMKVVWASWTNNSVWTLFY